MHSYFSKYSCLFSHRFFIGFFFLVVCLVFANKYLNQFHRFSQNSTGMSSDLRV